MNDTKSLFASKTVWLNLLTTLSLVGALLMDQDWIKSNPVIVSKVGACVGIVNIVLRIFFTTKPVDVPTVGIKALVWGGLLCLTVRSASAQDPNLRTAALYDLRSKESTITVGYKIREFPDFILKGVTAEAWALGGFGTSSGIGTVGTALVCPFKVARNLTGFVGAALLGSPSRKAAVVPVVGFRIAAF